MNTKQLLREVSLGADLPDELLQKLAGISHVRAIPAGTVLFEEGTLNNELFLIWSGRVALDVHVPGHGNVRILTLGPGDMLAWSAVLELGEMTASAAVTEDAVIVAVPADLLLRECGKDHYLGYELMRRIARQLACRLLATRVQLIELLAPGAQADLASLRRCERQPVSKAR